jgi:hypothetical protein
VEHNYKNQIENAEYLFGYINQLKGIRDLQPERTVRRLLKQQGYSPKIITNIWKWFDFSQQKGVASF